jgi:hypothetical protein
MRRVRVSNLRLPLRLFGTLLLFAFVLVPVFQSAHMLTHIEVANAVLATAPSVQRADVTAVEEGVDGDPDFDKICLDCLALAAFSVLLPALAAYFSGVPGRLLSPDLDSRRLSLYFSALYLSRAPPQS